MPSGRRVPGAGVGDRHQGRRRASRHAARRPKDDDRRHRGIERDVSGPRHARRLGHGRQAGSRAWPADALEPGDAAGDGRSEHRHRHGAHRQRQQHRRARSRSPRPGGHGRIGVDARDAGVWQRRRAAPVQRSRRRRSAHRVAGERDVSARIYQGHAPGRPVPRDQGSGEARWIRRARAGRLLGAEGRRRRRARRRWRPRRCCPSRSPRHSRRSTRRTPRGSSTSGPGSGRWRTADRCSPSRGRACLPCRARQRRLP